MSLKGSAAIVGFSELPSQRMYPGRSSLSLCAEAATMAITDARLRREDIDGIITSGESNNPITMAEHMGIHPSFTQGMVLHGASGASGVATAAAAIHAGLATTVLCVFGANRDPNIGGPAGGGATSPGVRAEWEAPYGPVVAANGGYGLIKQRHMYEYGSTMEQFAKVAVDERFNALLNPNAVWQGQPITIEDVLNSRFTNDPIHLLESVMPCSGAAAVIVTSAERAKNLPNRPAYILGAGLGATDRDSVWQSPDMTTTPVAVSAPRAFNMAGYAPKDMQFAEFYDCYTILVAVSIEDAGFSPKGEIGNFYESTDTTYKGSFPINTDGGQISGGQPGGNAGGFRHVIEATRQLMGRAGERQVAKNDLCMVNG